LLTLAMGLASSVVHAERLPVKIFTTADGLAHNNVRRIVRDSRGFLWFCTFEGLSRFDGYGFTTYGVDQGLPSPVVNDLLENRLGEYWVATAAGLCRFNPRGTGEKAAKTGVPQPDRSNAMLTVFFPGETDESRAVTAVFEDHDGTIWCGTEGGLFRLEEQNGQVGFRFVELGAAAPVSTIIEDALRNLWIGSMNGIYRLLPDGRVEHYDVHHGLPDLQIHSLLADRENRIWVATRKGGLCRLVSDPNPARPVVARLYTKEDGLPTSWITQIIQASDGSLWAGSNQGLIQFIATADGSDFRFRAYSEPHGLSDHRVDSVTEDRNQNLWLGLSNGGTLKLVRSGFTVFAEADGFKYPNAIFNDRAGNLFVKNSTDVGPEVIKRYDRGRFIEQQFRLPKRPDYGWGWNQVLLEDRGREWWVATTSGICRFPRTNSFEQLARTKPKAVYTMRDGLAGNTILRLFEDTRGDIWISAVGEGVGLSRWERATEAFHHYTEADGLPASRKAYPTSFFEDHSGGVWIGFSFGGGLVRYRDGRFTRFTSSDGLAEGGIFNLFVDSSGRLWVPTTRGGVCRIDSPEAEHPAIATYTTAGGLSSNNAKWVIEDRWGRLYVGTARGIDRLDTATEHIKHYTMADGVPFGESNAALTDRDGTLWFTFQAGLVRLVPEPDLPQLSAPVLITGIRIAGDRQPISALGEAEVAPVELGADRNHLQVDFVALGFSPGEGLRYQHKLEGTGQDWSPLSDQRTVNFASLSPGRYRFMVRAINADGVISETPASFAFTILPPVWQRWWFVGIVAGILGLLVYSIFRYRLSRLLELERVRTRIAADLHDDIGAGLSRVAILSEVVKRLIRGGREGDAMPMLTEIADSARELLESMREIVWAIDPRRDSLDNLVSQIRQFASDLLEAQPIRWEFRVPEEMERIRLEPDQRRQLLLIFREALHNIERHSGCGNVFLSLALSNHQLEAKISDDGRGFAIPQIESTPVNRRGNGLENIRRRVTHLGGHLDIASAPGDGTSVVLTIPLKRR
jgi:ligand-binding sensor domain-containing protein/two-component sensor histidine kinase